MRGFNFLIWPTIAGIAIAVILLTFAPDLLNPKVAQVEIIQSDNNSVIGSSLGNGPVSYADAVDVAAPAVVNIYTQTVVPEKQHPLYNDPFFNKFFNQDMPQRSRVQSSLGSGVILSSEGYIVTNNHVIAGADSVIIALKDGRDAVAKVIGTDPETDLAVLKVDLINLPSITLSTANNLRVGDVVLAIGNPFGVGQTVTMGIISAKGRNSLGLNTYEDFIQTDAAINPGNSGGALINTNGHLIGINTAIFSKSGGSQGIGFAIPSRNALDVMQHLIRYGRVIRGWLGLEIQQLSPQLAESFGLNDMHGLLIAGLFRNSPAHQAGLQPGDIMLSINEEKIIDGQRSMQQIANYMPGDEVRIEILRNGNTQTITVIIGERPATRPEG